MTGDQEWPDGVVMVPREYVNEELAHRFHDTYERLAESFSYATRVESAVPWDEVPMGNRGLMEATVSEVVGPILDTVLTLRHQRDGLRKALQAAREDVEEWGAYASEYMQEKWDLLGALARIDAALQDAS